MRHLLKLTSGILVLGFFGCGKYSSHLSSTFIPQPVIRPLLVVMGGYSSCKDPRSLEFAPNQSPLGIGMHPKEMALRSNIEQSEKLTFDAILTCFTDDNKLNTVSSANWDNIDLDVDVDQFFHDFPEVSDAYTHVYIVGHSYGGWLAMKTVSLFQGMGEKLKLLYSIDPISRDRCKINAPTNWYECRRSPTDISDTERQGVHEKTHKWVNIYQTATAMLHADEISQAHENIKLSAQHWSIDTVDSVWDHLKSDLLQSLRD